MTIDVLVVTYNNSRHLEHLLPPLLGQPDIRIFVVDNNSHDNTPAQLASLLKPSDFCLNNRNVGFARAVNYAASQTDGSVIVILNPDARISAHSVRNLARELERSPFSVLSPLITHSGTSGTRFLPAGKMPTIWRMFCHLSGLSRIGGVFGVFEGHYLLAKGTPDSAFNVDWVSGACMSMSRLTWSQLGGLSERWFMYAEDVEFCYRARREGMRVGIAPTILCSHEVAGSQAPETVNVEWIRNLADFYSTYVARTRVQSIIWGLLLFAGMHTRAIVLRARHPMEPRRLEEARYRAYGTAALRWMCSSRTAGGSK